ncbi:MAG TPA: hypothetical protein VM557_12170 [Thermoanaerobaculia bacterium]|nr:hypothetical protein [Thermoanaerobaculia bacterium]
MRRLLTLLIFAALLASPAAAAWSRAGLYGADVRALVVDPEDPDLLYLGTSQGDVYVSRDGAATWSNPRKSTPFPGHVVDNLTLDADGRLWAAAWGLWGGSVIAVSEDGGVNWTRRDQGLEKQSLRAFSASSGDAKVLVAGGLEGVFVSKDEGRRWTRISDHVNVESVAVDPRDSNTIYVGTWRQAWRTDDGGKTWKHIAKGMVLDTDVFAINLDPKNPDDIWVSTCGWVYNSKDRGDSWTRFKEGFENRRIHTVERDPLNPNVLFAGSVAGVYCSTDGGKKWALTSPDSLVANAMVIHPARPERIVLGTESDGIYISQDKGKTWARSSRGLHNVRVASIVPDPVHDRRIYATVYFGGSASGLYVSTDGGANWGRLNKTKLPEILTLLVRKDAEPRFLAGTEQGFFYSGDGINWERSQPSIEPIRVEKIIEYNSSRLFAGTATGVMTSRDAGKSWYRLGLDERALDIALGWMGKGPALYALGQSGLMVYDGTSWSDVAGAPRRGQTLAVRREGTADLVMVAGSDGVVAGIVDATKKWKATKAPTGDAGSVFKANAAGTLVVSFNNRHEIHFSSEPGAWEKVAMPTTLHDLAGIAVDPFRSKRFYFGTHGQGILIWDESPVDKPAGSGSQIVAGGGAK